MARRKIDGKRLFEETLNICDESFLVPEEAPTVDEEEDEFYETSEGADTSVEKIFNKKVFVDSYTQFISKNIFANQQSGGEGVQSVLTDDQNQHLKELITKAADALEKENEKNKPEADIEEAKSKNSLTDALQERKFWARVSNRFAKMFHAMSKAFGVSQPYASELFMEAAQYGQQIKIELEKAAANNAKQLKKEGARGLLGDLIKQARINAKKDERTASELIAEVAQHNQSTKFKKHVAIKIITKEKDGKVIKEKQLIEKFVPKTGAIEKLQAMARGNAARRKIEFKDGHYVRPAEKEKKTQSVHVVQVSKERKDMQDKWVIFTKVIANHYDESYEKLEPILQVIESRISSSAYDLKKLEADIAVLKKKVNKSAGNEKDHPIAKQFEEFEAAVKEYLKKVKSESKDLSKAISKEAKAIAGDKQRLKDDIYKEAKKLHTERLKATRTGLIKGRNSIF